MSQASQVVIIGGGIMGGDIATVFAARNWKVHVMSPSQKTRDALAARLNAGLNKVNADASCAHNVATYARLGDIAWDAIDLVIEAVTEDLPLKQKLFAQLETLARPDTPLTTNTSNFKIGSVSQGLKSASRMAGLHFFMPAHLVPLVEVVSADSTDPAVAARLEQMMNEVGKAPIRVNKDVPGFVGNRLQQALMREAMWMIHDGVTTAEGIDTAVRYGFGFRFVACGPFLQKEMSGWDTNFAVATALYPDLHNENAPPPFFKQMVERGHVGMKAKHGFWPWTDESIAQEKARIEKALQAGFAILEADKK
ncbi:MAG TPA: 3-hydroxyacyl-CoA dehydrogenase NAD-binding domain-containing protein [Burkholderiales bacterium]|nr:3-hydroxyacyl-CoA dehydrogenase NAD-binding domain-containing protein [Burkholderiales bacterium]